jgi:FtsP/CotA-like multicopper oxidase with cupredoxin domain
VQAQERRERLLTVAVSASGVLIFVGVMAVVLLTASAIQGGAPGNAPPSTASQERAMQAGMPFVDPPDLNTPGQANVALALTAEPTRFNLSGLHVAGESYDGSFVGPTLYLQPGGHLDLSLTNRLSTLTDLHFHGMHVSPTGDADNMSISVAPGDRFVYHLDIPADHPQGTFWYHDHELCGSEDMSMPGMPASAPPAPANAHCSDVESQLFAGLAGTIVVGDDRSLLPPELRNIVAHTLAFKDIQVDQTGQIVQNAGSSSIDSNAPTVRLVNGLLQPVLSMHPGETQLWRLANEGADIFYDLQLDGYSFTVIGEDGCPSAQVTAADTLLLPPAKRYDVLVTASSQPGGSTLRTLAYSNGPQGDSYPDTSLLTLSVSGQPETAARMPVGPLTGSPGDLSSATIAQSRAVTLGENSDGTEMFINGNQFDWSQSVFSTPANLGTVEEWTVVNTSGEIHPFHLHTAHFQVMSINGVSKPYSGVQDTIPVPDQENGVPGRVVIRIPFDDFAGQWMFHCRIAAHEDAGMMSFIDVAPASP